MNLYLTLQICFSLVDFIISCFINLNYFFWSKFTMAVVFKQNVYTIFNWSPGVCVVLDSHPTTVGSWVKGRFLQQDKGRVFNFLSSLICYVIHLPTDHKAIATSHICIQTNYSTIHTWVLVTPDHCNAFLGRVRFDDPHC